MALTIEPQEGAGGLLPRPRKASEASASTAKAKTSEAWTISGAVMFGKMCAASTRGVGGSDGDGGFDVGGLADGQRRAADDAHEGRHVDDGDGDHGVGEVVARAA